MKYLHIPVDFEAPTDEDFDRFRAAFEATAPDKVHVHCIFNWRVSAFFYRYYRHVLNMNESAARETMDSVWKPEGVWADFVLRDPHNV
jgi:hypothetical protein